LDKFACFVAKQKRLFYHKTRNVCQKEGFMRASILKAVANPPKILWGPFLPVMINMGIQFPMLFMFLGTLDINPIWFMASLLLGHVFCIALGAKEPHVSAMIQAYGQAYRTTNNLYKEKGNKFAP
jgi:hypothetical protein